MAETDEPSFRYPPIQTCSFQPQRLKTTSTTPETDTIARQTVLVSSRYEMLAVNGEPLTG